MNAAVVHSFDTPPRYDSFADPIAAEGEALVTVAAAGLHQIVKSLAKGTHYGSAGVLPFIPGVDGVGRLEDGARVYFGAARSPFGSLAERSITSRAFSFPLPGALDDATAAGIANPGMSSWAALKLRAHLTAGESVLILGATGVAGRLAIQIAKRLGASRVVAAGRNAEALAQLTDLGAETVIPLQQEHDALVSAFREEKCDVVLDYVWGAPAESLIEAISQKGLQHASSRIRYLQVGSTAGPKISLPAEALRSSGLELLGSGFGSVPIELILRSVSEFFAEAARKPFQFNLRTAALRDVEKLWNSHEQGARLVFQP
jgi:NADPH:quinone reductase-like Zn-dependent oxidoreductase